MKVVKMEDDIELSIPIIVDAEWIEISEESNDDQDRV